MTRRVGWRAGWHFVNETSPPLWTHATGGGGDTIEGVVNMMQLKLWMDAENLRRLAAVCKQSGRRRPEPDPAPAAMVQLRLLEFFGLPLLDRSGPEVEPWQH